MLLHPHHVYIVLPSQPCNIGVYSSFPRKRCSVQWTTGQPKQHTLGFTQWTWKMDGNRAVGDCPPESRLLPASMYQFRGTWLLLLVMTWLLMCFIQKLLQYLSLSSCSCWWRRLCWSWRELQSLQLLKLRLIPWASILHVRVCQIVFLLLSWMKTSKSNRNG